MYGWRVGCAGVHSWKRSLRMTANGTGSFDMRAFLSSAPIRWLITGGVFLIAAIAIGTTIMVDNFRERAINSNERELENTVLLLAISINSLKISRSSSRTLQRKSIRTD